MEKMTLDAWKKGVLSSSHIKPGEVVTFAPGTVDGITRAHVVVSVSQSVFIGAHFRDGTEFDNDSRGWYYE